MRAVLLAFWLLMSLTLRAQVPVEELRLELRSGSILLAPLEPGDVDPFPDPDPKGNDLFLFVRFDHTLSGPERERATAMGIRFFRSFRPHGWTVTVPKGVSASALYAIGLRGWHVPEANDRLHPEVRPYADDRDLRRARVDVVVFPRPDLASTVVSEMRLFKGRSTEPLGEHGALIATLTGKEIARLAKDPHVLWIEPAPAPGEPEDLRGRTYHRVHPISTTEGNNPGLDGTGVTVVVNDDGFVGPHIDFTGRTEQGPVANDLNGDHGDMVAGIVGGAGNLDPRMAGMAPGAFILVRQYQSSLPNTVSLHQNEGAMIFSSSYSNGCNAGYTGLTQQVDEEIIDNPTMIQVFSAGNAGTSDCGYGAGSFWGNITGGHKIAKNCIATANLTDTDGLIASSSRGPSADGRIKPDIGAFGNGQISTDPNNTYAAGSGTSAAAPGVSGVLAVLYEGYRLQEGIDPPSGLMKAILLNTADDLGNAGPDYGFGWGRMNATRAYQAMEELRWETASVDQGQSQQHLIDVPPGTAEVRFMVYWMDPAASLQSPTALVNDIDMIAVDPGQQDHFAWTLSSAANSALLAAPATRSGDHMNNVEQVQAESPAPGTWTITVTGFDIPIGPQEYFLVYEFIPEPPRIMYPLTGDVLGANESHRFRWDAYDHTQPFLMELSLTGGLTWGSFPSIPGTQRYTDLGLGDTIVTEALLRITQNGSSDVQGPFTIMRTPAMLNVYFNCTDSAGLAWPPVPGATGYVLYKLGAQFMDSVAFTTDTNHVYTGLQGVHNDWFAVAAIAPNGVVGVRSIALARPHPLFNCIAARDIATLDLRLPEALVIQCQSDPPVELLIANQGAQFVSDIEVGHRANGGNSALFPLTVNLAPGDSLWIQLPQQSLNLDPNTFNTFEVWASAINESFPVNDTLETQLLTWGIDTPFPYFEDFDAEQACNTVAICDENCTSTGSLINGRNGIEDDIDWRVDTASTPTPNTGPSVDHTLGNFNGRFVYLESSGGCEGLEALLISPCITLSTGQAVELSFWYHMFGSLMGELHVDLMVDGLWQEDLMAPIIGDQGDQWSHATADLSAFGGRTITIRFRGITGAGNTSDMALDDIGFSFPSGIEDQLPGPDLIVRPIDDAGRFEVRVDTPFPVDAQLSIHDATGRLVQRRRVGGQRTILLDLSDESSGVYVIRSSGSGAQHMGRVVR